MEGLLQPNGSGSRGATYFFLYPVGHLGPTAVTFLVSLPLTQVIVLFKTRPSISKVSKTTEFGPFQLTEKANLQILPSSKTKTLRPATLVQFGL
jgi:hypothetical protein